MQRGKVVESGDARTVLDNPQHPYSIAARRTRSCRPKSATDGAHDLTTPTGEEFHA